MDAGWRVFSTLSLFAGGPENGLQILICQACQAHGERILFRGQARDDCCVQKATGFLRRAVVSESSELYKIRYFAFLFLDRSIANADDN